MKIFKTFELAALLGAGLLLAPACGGEDSETANDDSNCVGAKCDTPTGEPDAQCKDRQAEVLGSSNNAFTREAIRWACADVEGVNAANRDSRGQEYCEYFALFQPPPLEEGSDERPDAVDLGRPTNAQGAVTNLTICVDEDGDGVDDDGRGSDECRVTLNEDQFIYLEENGTDIVGQCVFTSWHADIDIPVKACQGDGGKEDCGDGAAMYNFPFTAENFRMKISFNSNRAAADLVEQCFDPRPNQDIVPADWKNEDDPLVEPFFRGCMEVQGLFGTGWRRSDPSVCAVANRLRECGCAAPGVTNAVELGDAVVPPQPNPDGEVDLRGFPLGGWTDKSELPPGCRYADIGEDTQAIVLCDLTANDVFASLNDPKEVCRATYGNQVVVHVPLPADAITCKPSGEPGTESCGKEPWIIGNEGEVTDPDPDPEPEPEPEPEPDPDTLGNCCEVAADGRVGCENQEVADCVAAKDSWCGTNGWDKACVDQVTSLGCGTC
ncbi:MAG: hypothetical protein AAF721_06830 [Myxococcota bacterium]